MDIKQKYVLLRDSMNYTLFGAILIFIALPPETVTEKIFTLSIGVVSIVLSVYTLYKAHRLE